MRQQIEACCADRANRVLLEFSTESTAEGIVTRKVEQCIACSRKHYIMSVPPVEIGIAGAGIG